MDSVFLFGEDEVSAFFQHMHQDFGCTYLCLWLYSPQGPKSANCLRYKGGFYIQRSIQPSSSSGTLAQRLFIEYQQSVFALESSHIPGLAFQSNLPYMEFHVTDLLALATAESQRQFYQEAGIKTAVFMGCNAGEIEMGFSNESQVNLETHMRNWFPEDFSRVPLVSPRELPQPTDPNPAASSSSSLRSLSYDSSEYSPLLFEIPTSSYPTEPRSEPATLEQALRPAPSSVTYQQSIQGLNHIQSTHFPPLESEDEAITRAMLAVISSTPSLPPQNNVLPPRTPVNPRRESAFKSYGRCLGVRNVVSGRQSRQNMMKRSIVFMRNLHAMRAQLQMHTPMPSSTQLHHMFSERRRREKINESFQSLRSLLPPGTKKDKASLLARTTEYLRSLITQVEELNKRNEVLEAKLLPQKAAAPTAKETTSDSSNGGLDVRIVNVGESTSEARMVDLHVTKRGDSNMHDNVVRLLEFLRLDENVTLISIEANSKVVDSASDNQIVLRLKIEGNEWDEAAFQEAIKRILNE